MTLNDQIATWLSAQGVTSADYRTGHADGEPDAIIHWGDDLPPQPTADELAAAGLIRARSEQTALINAACQFALISARAPYSSAEALTWAQQLAEAQAGSGPLLSTISTASGRTVAELCARVLELNAAWQAASGAIIGKRQALASQIANAQTVDSVQAVIW
jgi:hypothetical protein